MIRTAVAALAAATLVLAACTNEVAGTTSRVAEPMPTISEQSTNAETLAALDDARRVWRASNIGSYRFTIEWICFCPPTRGTVEVRDGEVLSVIAMSEEADIAVLERTIDDLFEMVAAAAATNGRQFGEPGEVTAVFHPEFGLPLRVSADPLSEAIDDEFGWRITGFVALDGAAFDDPDGPAGIHECALLTRGEVDSVLGVGTSLGEYSTPAITISVCTWTSGGSSLVLTLFPAPDGGLAVPYPDARPSPDGILMESSGRRTLVVTDADGTVVALEGNGADLGELTGLLRAIAGRLP